MKLLKQLILNIVANAAILYIVSTYLEELGLSVATTNYNVVVTFVVLGAIFWFLNTIIKRILNIVTLPLRILTLGLSSILVNIAIFYIFQRALTEFNVGITIQLASLVQVIILSIIITIIYFLIKKII